MDDLNALVILQARMGSSRLPGKVMLPINGKPMIYWQLERIKQSKCIDGIVVATSTDSSDDQLADFLISTGVEVVRGPLTNVAVRFSMVVDKFKPKNFIRLTGDCPFVMPELIDSMLKVFNEKDVDYLSNTSKPMYPDGLDIEIVRSESFLSLLKFELSDSEKEHVTLGIYTRPKVFTLASFSFEKDLSNLRWTVDYPEDYAFVVKIFAHFQNREFEFGLKELIDFLSSESAPKNSISGELRNESLKNLPNERE